MNIVVLAGGSSTERDVSIVSGVGVCKALRSKGHRAILLDVFFGRPEIPASIFSEQYDVDAEAEYIKSQNDKVIETQSKRREFFGTHVTGICAQADIVFMALHGANGEDGKVQAAFDLLGIKYTGSGHLSSGMAMDKTITKKIFKTCNVPAPVGVSLRRNNCSKILKDYDMDFPVVVKPCCGGSSVGVCIAHNQEEYERALAESFAYEEETVVEQYIEGREFSVGIIAGKALPVIEIAPIEGFYDYQNKYQAGAAIETCPAELPDDIAVQMQAYAKAAYEALSLAAYARIDFMMNDKEELFCLEANTLPGMTPTSLLPQEARAVGIDFPSLCENLIEVSLKKYDNM